MNYIVNIDYSIIRNEKLKYNYDYNFLEIIEDHVDIDFYADILNTLDLYTLKNIWNSIVKKWTMGQKKMSNKKDKKYLASPYSEQNYYYIHELVTSKRLNDLLNEFINNDKFKAIFVVNCILTSLY